MEVWRLGQRAPGEVKIWGFGGRSFSFDNRPDRVEWKWLEEENSLCFPEEELCLEQLVLESLAKLHVLTVEPPERETSAARPNGQDPWEGSGRCSWSRGCLRHVGTYPAAREGSWSLPFALRGK